MNTVWDVQFKKGWNEMVMKIDNTSLSGITKTTTTNILSNLKWVFGASAAVGTASQVKRFKSRRSNKLFV